ARPSAAGAFLGRALRGDWAGAVQAALWPVGFVLVAAVALGIPSYGQDSEDAFVGFGDRLRLALAVLLQGVGGGFEASAGGSGGGSPLYGGDYGSGGSGSAALSVVPLLVTVVWIVALVLGVRMLRTRLYARTVPGAPDGATAGLEAAVRVALATTAGTLALALFAQPDIAEVSISSSPFLTALWTLLLALGVAGGVLHADDLRYRVAAARPGVRMTVRAAGTAVRALGVVLVLALVLGWIGLALFGDGGGSPSDVGDDEFGGSDAAGIGAFLLLLPNFGLAVLGLCWGAPLEVEARGTSGFGGGYERESFGLSRLGDELGSGAVVYALAVGLVCALVAGTIAVRRSADRREHLLSAGLFFGLFLLLAGVGGLGAEFRGDIEFLGTGSGSFDLGVSVPEALLFGLLWTAGAAFVAPHL
ncbi:zinc ribbon domain-containing protein, partial [Streptomyces sp. SID5785]|uniref:zinc ribbon domain-containing protein n=1 Tax=Streptomyces sp. SID5785 TaxID=2690309 RepID=UPI00136168EC